MSTETDTLKHKDNKEAKSADRSAPADLGRDGGQAKWLEGARAEAFGAPQAVLAMARNQNPAEQQAPTQKAAKQEATKKEATKQQEPKSEAPKTETPGVKSGEDPAKSTADDASKTKIKGKIDIAQELTDVEKKAGAVQAKIITYPGKGPMRFALDKDKQLVAIDTGNLKISKVPATGQNNQGKEPSWHTIGNDGQPQEKMPYQFFNLTDDGTYYNQTDRNRIEVHYLNGRESHVDRKPAVSAIVTTGQDGPVDDKPVERIERPLSTVDQKFITDPETGEYVLDQNGRRTVVGLREQYFSPSPTGERKLVNTVEYVRMRDANGELSNRYAPIDSSTGEPFEPPKNADGTPRQPDRTFIPALLNPKLDTNGNFSYEVEGDKSGVRWIMRGNGVPLATGEGREQFTFHEDGNFNEIIPPQAALAAGAPKLSFPSYIPDMAQFTKAIETITGGIQAPKVTTRERKDNSDIWNVHTTYRGFDQKEHNTDSQYKGPYFNTPNGSNVIEETLGAGANPLRVSRYRYPNGMQERLSDTLRPDGVLVRRGFDPKTPAESKPEFISMQTRGKDGKWGPRFSRDTTKTPPVIGEYDPGLGGLRQWNQRADGVSVANTTRNVRGEDGQPKAIYEERRGLNVLPTGEVTYTDQQGNRHTEVHRSEDIQFIDGSKRHFERDEKHRIIFAGKDAQNGWRYEHAPNSTIDKPEIAKATKVVNDQKISERIPATPDERGVLYGDMYKPEERGKFLYCNQSQDVFIEQPDLVTIKSSYNPATGYSLAEASSLDGKRKFGPQLQGSKPTRYTSITDTFNKPGTGQVTRLFEAVALPTNTASPATSPMSPTAPETAEQKAEKMKQHLPLHIYTLKTTARPDVPLLDSAAPSPLAESIPSDYIDVTVNKNADVFGTGARDHKRYLFQAGNMANSPVVVAGDQRLALAKQEFYETYHQEIFQKHIAAPALTQTVQQAIGSDAAQKYQQYITSYDANKDTKLDVKEIEKPADEYMSILLRHYNLANLPTGSKDDLAYRFELASAFIRGLAEEMQRKAHSP